MRTYSTGMTLIELMIVVAIIAIIAAVAVPAYNQYIRESQFAAAKANVEPLRLAVEDFWLDNGSYGADATYTFAKGSACDDSQTLDTQYDWCPDADEGKFDYSVTVASGSYSISVQHDSGRKVTCKKSTPCTYN